MTHWLTDIDWFWFDNRLRTENKAYIMKSEWTGNCMNVPYILSVTALTPYPACLAGVQIRCDPDMTLITIEQIQSARSTKTTDRQPTFSKCTYYASTTQHGFATSSKSRTQQHILHRYEEESGYGWYSGSDRVVILSLVFALYTYLSESLGT